MRSRMSSLSWNTYRRLVAAMREQGVNRFVSLGALVAVAFGALIVARSFSGSSTHEVAPHASAVPTMAAPTGTTTTPTAAPSLRRHCPR